MVIASKEKENHRTRPLQLLSHLGYSISERASEGRPFSWSVRALGTCKMRDTHAVRMPEPGVYDRFLSRRVRIKKGARTQEWRAWLLRAVQWLGLHGERQLGRSLSHRFWSLPLCLLNSELKEMLSGKTSSGDDCQDPPFPSAFAGPNVYGERAFE